MDRHVNAVARIAEMAARFYEARKPFRIYHGSTNSTRPHHFNPEEMIDTSMLNDILHIDTQALRVLVEPNVSMDKLVARTLQDGLLPPVVMEFPGITVGGGFSGTGGESSSFKYGLFEQTVASVEIVVPTGEIITASPENNTRLFYGAASSFGTLGVITLLEIKLIRAKPYVELIYYPIFSAAEAAEKLKKEMANVANDYIDGILFAKDRGIVCAGRLTSSSEISEIHRFSRPRDPWFYLHAQDIIAMSRKTPTREIIPLVDYLFRYDRGGFWVGHFAFKYFLVPFNRFTRWFLDDFLHTRMMFHSLHQSGLHKQYFLQDVAIPFPAANQFLEYVDQSLGYYPLWLCPLQQAAREHRSLFSPSISTSDLSGSETFLNVGIWAIGPTNTHKYVCANRELEMKVQELGGKKWLYAQTFYTPEQFGGIYDHEEYDALRKEYSATHLPSIYDKVNVDSKATIKRTRAARFWSLFWDIWPLRGWYGLFHAMFGWISGSEDLISPNSWRSRISSKIKSTVA